MNRRHSWRLRHRRRSWSMAPSPPAGLRVRRGSGNSPTLSATLPRRLATSAPLWMVMPSIVPETQREAAWFTAEVPEPA